MPYLIDGYNLLHAMGAIRGRLGPAGLYRARLRLLGLLQGAHGDEAGDVTVVFDAAHPPPGAAPVEVFGRIHVRFAVGQEQADDLIEQLIRQQSAPRQLMVVSDDHRLREAARRRRCPTVGCQEYLEQLQRRRARVRRAARDDGEKPPVAREAEHWLNEFASLEDDPELKAWFELDRFPEEGRPE
jgi:predicted RNA-binding protein with PIN domain